MAIRMDAITLYDLRKLGFSLPLSAPDRAVVTYFAKEYEEQEFHQKRLRRPDTYYLKMEWQEEIPYQGNPMAWWPRIPPEFTVVNRKAGWTLSEEDVIPILDSDLMEDL